MKESVAGPTGKKSVAPWLAVGVLACCLVAAVLVRLRTSGGGVAQAASVRLASRLPTAVPGWTVKDLPVGEGEAGSARVEEILRYDDVVFREYSAPRGKLAVYIAYWRPGKVPVQIPAAHTPDRCWTYVGWKCEAMRFHEPMDYGRGVLEPGQWRQFSVKGGPPLFVVFWHLAGGKIYDYGEVFHGTVRPLSFWRDQLRSLVFASGEQYFIRVSSDRPFDQLLGDEGVRDVMAALADFGLAAKAAGARL